MLRWAIRLMESTGYGGIVLLMLLENVFPPIPSEVILPLAGLTAARGQLWLPGVILAATVGSLLGALSLYYLGKRFGAQRLEDFAERHGAWLAVSGDDIKRAMQWFHQHGIAIILIGRVIPGVRSLISIPAGVCGMALPQFLLYSAIGTVVWTAVLTYLGSMLGENYHTVAEYVGPASTAVFIVIIAAFVIRAIRQKWSHTKGQSPSSREPTSGTISKSPLQSPSQK
jgi:membrane protein DedA with SNARE-associated domain